MQLRKWRTVLSSVRGIIGGNFPWMFFERHMSSWGNSKILGKDLLSIVLGIGFKIRIDYRWVLTIRLSILNRFSELLSFPMVYGMHILACSAVYRHVIYRLKGLFLMEKDLWLEFQYILVSRLGTPKMTFITPMPEKNSTLIMHFTEVSGETIHWSGMGATNFSLLNISFYGHRMI